MLQLVFNTLRDSLLQVIIPVLLTQANLEYREIGIFDSAYVCKVHFQPACFFIRSIDYGNELVTVQSLDSTYLAERFAPYFSKYSRTFLGSMAQNGFARAFLRFHNGVFWRDDNGLRIDVALSSSPDTIKFGIYKEKEYIGTTAIKPFFIFLGKDSLTDKLYELVGPQRFNAIMVFLHEADHFKDYLNFKKKSPQKKLPRYFKKETETDTEAIRMLNAYWKTIEFSLTKK